MQLKEGTTLQNGRFRIISCIGDGGFGITYLVMDEKLRREVENRTIEELIEIIKVNNPEKLLRLDLKNKRRLERAAEKVLSGNYNENPSNPLYETLVIGVTWPREVLYERIRERLDRRLDQGMIDEVVNLRKAGCST